MIPLHNFPITGKEIQRLTRVNEHLKESYKISFLTSAVELKKSDQKLSTVYYHSSILHEDGWEFKKEISDKFVPMCEFCSSLLSMTEFKNRPISENVYFYRYLNIVRNIVGEEDFNMIIQNSSKYDTVFENNVKEYVDYRSKIVEMLKCS
jgi:hypothetical protein